MAVSTSELTIVYGAVTFGGSTARQITGWVQDEHDFINGQFEFEFVTTATSDSAFSSELDTVRNELRRPRQDLTVTQNGVTTLSRRHSNNTALNTFPHIVKDGDPADTGRSRHFRIRIQYELPADNVSTSFRRGSTTTILFTPSRRRTVTISGVYTANSTDGTTAANTQYFNQIAAAETSLLNVVDSSATWERVGQPEVEYFETRKLVRFTRVYRELNVNQAIDLVDNTAIIDPHLEIVIEQMGIDDSLEQPPQVGGGSPQTGGNQTVTDPTNGASGTTTGSPLGVKKPVLFTATYDADINFDVTTDFQGLFDLTIRPWIVNRVQAYQINNGGTLILMDESPGYEMYENHIRAQMQFMSYSLTIIKHIITYDDVLTTGEVFRPTTGKSRFRFYRFHGPAIRQLIITEEIEERTAETSARVYENKLYRDPGSIAANLGAQWIMLSRQPKAMIKSKGLTGSTQLGLINIAIASVQTVFQFIDEMKPSVANAGGITGSVVTQ